MTNNDYKRYPVNSTVTYEGQEWTVISTYFELRKLERNGNYKSVTVFVLDEHQNKQVKPLAGDDVS
jgi:hypothetical protein